MGTCALAAIGATGGNAPAVDRLTRIPKGFFAAAERRRVSAQRQRNTLTERHAKNRSEIPHAASVRLLSALLLAVPALACAQSAERPEVTAAAARLQSRVVEWRRDFHQHPELSNREERNAAKVAERLRALGLKPQTGIAHHGVVAIIKGVLPGPKIALRADMDALPVTEQTGLTFASKATGEYRGETVGVMHACGHDAHTSILLGVAEALVAMRAQLPGEVMLVFQPSEEGAPGNEEGGAALMLKEGLFRDFKPAAMFGLHVFSSVQAGKIAAR